VYSCGGMPEEAPVATPSSSGSDEDLLRLSVKELKNRITKAGGSVPAGHLEKSDLVSALQETLRNGGSIRNVDSSPSAANPVTAAPQMRPPAEPADGKGQEDLAKLSVGEIKRRLRWAGAPVPAGHLEKAELVSALRVALQAKAKSEQAAAQQGKAKTADPPKSSSTTPRPAESKPAPKPKDTAAIKEQQDTTKWFVMPEEDLKCLIVDAGGKVPDGNPGRHYLVAVLKNALKAKASTAAKLAEPVPTSSPCAEPVMQTDKVIEEVAATPAEAPSAPAEEATPAAQPAPPPEPREWDPDEDVSKLSAGELKRRIREYDEALLVGLAEKSELVAALQKANASGPPPVRAPVNGTATAPPATAPSAATTVELDDTAMQAQMEEMQNLLAAAEADVAGTPLEAAAASTVAAPSADIPPEVHARPMPAGGSRASPPTIEVAEEKPPPSSKPAAPAVVTATVAASTRAGKRRRQEVTISDDEDQPKVRRVKAARISGGSPAVKISGGSAATVAIDDDDECVQAVDAESPLASARQPAAKATEASEEPAEDGTWI